ncbi:MAG: primosomal protein N' [Myxococcales bacterium]|nr:primosomal protein N' [Myxococcales bacterium]
MSEARLVEVAVAIPRQQLFTYAVPESLGDRVRRGSRVLVPFARRKEVAVVVRDSSGVPDGVNVLPILGLVDDEPVFDEPLLDFLEEAARYYFHPLGEVLRAASPSIPTDAVRRLRRAGSVQKGERVRGPRLPSREELYVARTSAEPKRKLGTKQAALLAALDGEPRPFAELAKSLGVSRSTLEGLEEQGLVRTEVRHRPLDPFFRETVARDVPPELTVEQEAAVAAIRRALDGAPEAFLLRGVTGSGKTEVYLRAMEDALSRGRGALLLVPEISLTPQLVSRYRARFGDDLAVLHSGLDKAQRDAAWRGLRRGELRVAIGARSALFSPVADLGVIIVDEEHDPSFKQEEGFRYHARDMALLRAHRAGAVCILGSATPSLESMYGVERGRLHLLRLTERATGAALPHVEVVDLKTHLKGPTGHPLVSFPLASALRECLARGEQAILFLNRRGYAPALRCEACGTPAECPSCSVALTEHKAENLLRCHHCDYFTRPQRACAACGAGELVSLSLGTERLEEHLAEAFAPARIGRLDRDVADEKGIERVLDQFRRREIDVLVGTQMVTKGHDVPNVTLVGVILADQSLAFPDFRAAERTFQLLSQVAGRAGRGDRPGKVVIQTYRPDDFVVQCASRHDDDAFYARELAEREELPNPPFAHLAVVRMDSASEREVEGRAAALASLLSTHPLVRDGRVDVLGPAPALLKKVRNRYRMRITLRARERAPLRKVLAALLPKLDELPATTRASLDVDPVSVL